MLLAIIFGSFVALIAVLSLWLLYKNMRHPLGRYLTKVPLPRPLWKSAWLGHFGDIMAQPPGEPQLAYAKAHGDLLLYFGQLQTPRIMVADPAVLKDVLVLRPEVFDKPDFTVRVVHVCALCRRRSSVTPPCFLPCCRRRCWQRRRATAC
jgi:hypothetical protein